jgi:hypothetical protein
MVSTTLRRMFTTAEREALVEEWNRVAAEPGPPDRRSIGCMTVVIVIILAIGFPPLMRWLGIEVPGPVRTGAAILMLVLLIAGVVVGLFFGSGRFGHAYGRADAAVEWLAAHGEGGEADERRRQAVTLLYHAYCVDGPSTTGTIDFAKARERLGAALPYVMEVERCLAVDAKIYRVFTDDKVRLPG